MKEDIKWEIVIKSWKQKRWPCRNYSKQAASKKLRPIVEMFVNFNRFCSMCSSSDHGVVEIWVKLVS